MSKSKTEKIITKKPRIKTQQLVYTPLSEKEKNFSKIDISEEILFKIGALADETGVEVYVVGGYVRDYFLNRDRTDFDCTVVGDAIAFANLFAKRMRSNAVIYEKFKTALVPVGELKVEFVGTRKEVYSVDSRNPSVTEGTLEEDLARRDFTINAMAASLNKVKFGEVIDLFNGAEDLQSKILRTPLDPVITYNDDPLRMMRLARFASQLGFDTEKSSFDAIKGLCDRISIISKERISDELLKIISSQFPSKGFKVLFESGLLKFIFPELNNLSGVEVAQDDMSAYYHKDVFWHSLKVLDNIAKVTDNIWLRFAALVHDIAKPKSKKFIPGIGWTFHGHEEFGARMLEKIFRNMKLPMNHVEYIQKLVRLHQRPMVLVDEGVTDSAIRRLAFTAGDALEDLFMLCKADITTKNPNLTEKYISNYEIVFQKVMEVQEKDRLREFQSPVRGEMIMEICNLPASKSIGIIKSMIEEAILDGIIANDFDEAMNFFLKHKEEWIDLIFTGQLGKVRKKY
ncbi:MAG: HD domain-containing protein [Candidatus Kapabacteria bacterium]|nr:HD domain-containing protein [Candidatus Kapabacteria bacterium]